MISGCVVVCVGWLKTITGLWCCSDLRVVGSLSLAASPALDGFVCTLLSFCHLCACPRSTGKPIWSIDWIHFLTSVNSACFFFKVVVSACVGLIHLHYSSVQIRDRFLYLKTWRGNVCVSIKCYQIHGIHNR